MWLRHSKKRALKRQQSTPCFHVKESQSCITNRAPLCCNIKGFTRTACTCARTRHVCKNVRKIIPKTIILNLALSLEENYPLQEVQQASDECVACK